MSLKATDIVVSDSEVSSVIDIVSELDASEAAKDRIKSEVGEFLVTQILSDVAESRSPVTGRVFRGLSPRYKKEKVEAGYGSNADLEATGAMLSSLEFEVTEDGIKIGVFGPDAGKADGHNNFSGDSELPLRQFLPNEGQGFRPDIRKDVDEIINDILADETAIDSSDLSGVESRDELLSRLSSLLGIAKFNVARAVLGNQKLLDLLDDLDLLDML